MPTVASQPARLAARTWRRTVTVAVALLLLAVAFWGLLHILTAVRRDAALRIVDEELAAGRLQSACAALERVPDPQAPACQVRLEETSQAVAAVLAAAPEPVATAAAGLTAPPSARRLPVPARHPLPAAEAQRIQDDFRRVVGRVRDGKSIDEVAFDLSLPRYYVRVLLKGQPP